MGITVKYILIMFDGDGQKSQTELMVELNAQPISTAKKLQ